MWGLFFTAESIPSQISFSKLVSHTFPGVFATIGIFLILYTPLSNFINDAFSLSGDNNSWLKFIGAIGGLIYFGTIVGIIIDSVSHMIIEPHLDGWVNFFKSTKKLNMDLQEEKKTLNNYQCECPHLFYFVSFVPTDKFTYIDENYYCYQECVFNLSISFFFSAITYGIFFSKLGYGIIVVGLIAFVFIGLSFFCFYAGLRFYLRLKLDMIHFMKGAIDHY